MSIINVNNRKQCTVTNKHKWKVTPFHSTAHPNTVWVHPSALQHCDLFGYLAVFRSYYGTTIELAMVLLVTRLLLVK